LPPDFLSPSFSGWPIFVNASLPEEQGYLMAKAMHEAWDRLVFDSDEPVTLADVCTGPDAAPNDVPLHPGAARYFREQGCAV
jgi:TRAP-type uncharacterized transport system substrate-binding protein